MQLSRADVVVPTIYALHPAKGGGKSPKGLSYFGAALQLHEGWKILVLDKSKPYYSNGYYCMKKSKKRFFGCKIA